MSAHLHVVRSGTGPELVLLHGIGSSGTAWARQSALLGDAFTCIAPDLPGYGDSPDPSGSGLDAFVDPLVAMLAGRSAHLAGVSFGALAALALARRQPGLVRSLILADATLGRGRLEPEARAGWLAHRYALAGDLGARSRERAAEIAAPGAPADAIEEIAAHMRRARPAGYLAVAETIAATDAVPWLGEIQAPALVVCGEHDDVTGLGVSRTLVERLPDARLLTIAGAGHAPHIEQPDAFAAAVRAFLAGHD